MRTRAVVAIVVMLLPAGLEAQRIPLPRIGRRAPPAAPLPKQPPIIAQELAYRRLRIAVESYPMLSFVQSPGFASDGLLASWTTLGMGTRADYRLTSLVSATLDLTSSFLGGPAMVQTAEIGTRFRSEWSERRMYPFVDLRASYVSAYNRYLGTFGDDFLSNDGYLTSAYGYGARYSRGFGGVAGIGMEYLLTRRFSLTTAATVTRNQMRAYGLRDPGTTPNNFAMTTFRYTLGIKYNPVRMVREARTERP